MIRASKLDRLIRFQRETITVDDAGRQKAAWTTFAERRAEVVTANMGEGLKPFGEAEKATIVFRLRYFADVTTADRIHWNGLSFNVRQIEEIGRRRGLEVLCERVS